MKNTDAAEKDTTEELNLVLLLLLLLLSRSIPHNKESIDCIIIVGWVPFTPQATG